MAAYCEYECGCVAESRVAGQWTLTNICEKHKAPPPIEQLLSARNFDLMDSRIAERMLLEHYGLRR